MKRLIDKKIYLAAPLFTPAFFNAARRFMDLCYATFQGWGRDARLRTPAGRRRDASGGAWDPNWNDCFADEVTDLSYIQSAYQDVMAAFAADIGLYDAPFLSDTGTSSLRRPILSGGQFAAAPGRILVNLSDRFLSEPVARAFETRQEIESRRTRQP